MSLPTSARAWLRVLSFAFMMALAPAFGAEAPAPNDADTIVSKTPMAIEVDENGVHAQLVVATEILSSDTQNDLIYTITQEPRNGRVGLAGGGDETSVRNGHLCRHPRSW